MKTIKSRVVIICFVVALIGVLITMQGSESAYNVGYAITMMAILAGILSIIVSIVSSRNNEGAFSIPLGIRIGAYGMGVGLLGFISELIFKLPTVNKVLSFVAILLLVTGILIYFKSSMGTKRNH